MFDGQINLLFSCSEIKGVFNFSKKTGFIKNNTRLLSGLHLASKTERYMGRTAIFLYLLIEEQAKTQGHKQK